MVFTFILGILNVTKLRHYATIYPYGILTFLGTLFFLFYGIDILEASFYTQRALKDYCTSDNYEYWAEY